MDLFRAIISEGLVDSHYHIGPELLPRRYNVATLAKEAKAINASIVLKNHTYPTTPLASLARNQYHAAFMGGVVLNRYVGGLNPDAVFSAASGNYADNAHESEKRDPTFVVWMPTVHAVAHLETFGYGFDPRWSEGCCTHQKPICVQQSGIEKPVIVFNDNLTPRPELIEVLQAIKATNAVLATGHLSATEVEHLIPLALDIGVSKIIITHPNYPSTELPIRTLAKLTEDSRVFAEYCFAITTIEEVPIEAVAQDILQLNPKQIIIASDFGQIRSEPFPLGTRTMLDQLLIALKEQLSHRTVIDFFSANPKRALNFE